MKKFLLIVSLSALIISCKNDTKNVTSESLVSNKTYEKIQQLDWLLGTWTNQSADTFSQETWSRENDSTFTAFSFIQIAEETVFAETMALEQKGQSLLLTVATANEKNASPVTFNLISSEEKQFIFENRNHDFPKRITYTNPTKDSLHAWIEGTENNENKKVDFRFTRIK